MRSTAPGFSLAEVLIAIVIITILTIGSIAVYSTQLAKARDTERTSDIARISRLLDQFIAEYGLPPNSDIGNARRIRKDTVKTACDGASLFACFKAVGYSTNNDLYEMLTDPSQGIANNQSTDTKTYGYLYNADENSYKICSMLEDQGSQLLNFNYDGAGDAAGTGNDIYCMTYTPAGVQTSVENESVTRFEDIDFDTIND